MIVTLTPNPSLDRTVEIDELRRGEVQRATGGRVDPGGKGVNVSRALAANDIATVAVLPSGGPEGAQLAALLAPFGVQTVPVPIGGTVRSNITVAEPDGTTTKLNEAGPELSADEAAAVERTVVELGTRASWVVGAGSLPRGLGVDFYARLTTALRDCRHQGVHRRERAAAGRRRRRGPGPDQAQRRGARRARRPPAARGSPTSSRPRTRSASAAWRRYSSASGVTGRFW